MLTREASRGCVRAGPATTRREAEMDEARSEKVRVAACACGTLRVTVRGEPARVNICSCHQCQRRTGSAFSYTAFFAEGAVVAIEGDHRTWRGFADSGRWQDYNFCPICGVSLFSRMESMPGMIAVGAGAFADQDFPAPPKFYWSSKKHHWLALPEGIEALETQ
jgi:hypothetical protein